MNSINKSIDHEQSIGNQGKNKKKVLKFNILYFRKLNGSTRLRNPDGQQ